MEKMSAWQEVARRMAHEIKNPLTPNPALGRTDPETLQTDRARTGGRLSEPWQAEFDKFDNLLDECVQVIIQEAGFAENPGG